MTTSKTPTRTATKSDIKSGTVMIDKEGYPHTLDEKYSKGIWTTRQGGSFFENEVHHYTVKAIESLKN